MDKDPFMGLSAADIQKLAAQAGADSPITAVRVVGGRVELHLLGGTVTTLNQSSPSGSKNATTNTREAPIPTTTKDQLKAMTVRQLQDLASSMDLTGYRHLRKAELVDLIFCQL